MNLIKTKIEDCYLIRLDKFKDDRGFFSRAFCKKIFAKKKILNSIKQINFSFSKKKGTVRGLHLQKKPFQEMKIIYCTKGEIYDVVVDLRKKSKSFGKYFSIIISDKSDFSFYIPEGFAHGFLCISKKCTVNYKCSEYRNQKTETTLQWNDESVAIKWPIKKPLLSKKDKNGKSLNFFKI